MKAEKIIGNYCQLYGVTMPKSDLSQREYFVLIDSKIACVKTYHPSKLLGQTIGSAMRRGVVLHVCNGWVKLLEWDNWKEFWNRYFAPSDKRRKELPSPCREKVAENKMFREGISSRPSKRPTRKGFEKSYNANRNINLQQGYIRTTPIG